MVFLSFLCTPVDYTSFPRSTDYFRFKYTLKFKFLNRVIDLKQAFEYDTHLVG